MTYFTDRHALSGISEAETRLAYAMTVTPCGPTFVELIKTDGCFVIREHDLAGALRGEEPPPPAVLGAAYSAHHIAAMWERLAGDATTAYELERGRL